MGIDRECAILLQAIVAGHIVVWTYESIRVFRRLIRHNLFWISVEDLLFWIATGFYLCDCMCRVSDGAIRLYFFIGIILGGMFSAIGIQKIVRFLEQSAEKSIDKKGKTR